MDHMKKCILDHVPMAASHGEILWVQWCCFYDQGSVGLPQGSTVFFMGWDIFFWK